MKMGISVLSGHSTQAAITCLAAAEGKNAACVGASYLAMSRTAAVSHVHTKKTSLASAATAPVQSVQIAGGAAALLQVTQTANSAAAVKRTQDVNITNASASEALFMSRITQEHRELFRKWS